MNPHLPVFRVAQVHAACQDSSDGCMPPMAIHNPDTALIADANLQGRILAACGDVICQ
ncbi:hypothetical protein D3C78_1890550 [compost metagenome]